MPFKFAVLPVLMLVASNVFMTFAWYGQLKVEHRPLWLIVIISWGIAFFEYCLQVPANRWGYGLFTAAQLKILQEAITIIVFGVFAVVWLREMPRWNEVMAFGLIMLAVIVANLPHA